ncbi:MAG TPA: DUF1214 domain-containing protein [Acidimicrobiales bacterium]
MAEDQVGSAGPAPATAAAVRALIDALSAVEVRLREGGDRGLNDETAILEGYRWLFTVLHVGLQGQVWADVSRPRFVEIVGPYQKWGGDNADAFYQYIPIDPARTYRVWATRGDAAYFSLTVYGGPDDGRYSERIVGSINTRDLVIGDDGFVEFILSPEEHTATPWVKLEPDAVCAITRDYLDEPTTGRRMEWHIECLDPDPEGWRLTDEDMARRFGNATTWFLEQTAMAPVNLADPNTVAEPYPVPAETFGWAAGDAAYAMGSFVLADDEALVIRGRSPSCAFWNICLWNELLHTFNYDYSSTSGPVTRNGTQIAYEEDGSWVLVVAATDPGIPNWVSTQGHAHGLIWFRWFLPDETPARPTTEVVKLSAL